MTFYSDRLSRATARLFLISAPFSIWISVGEPRFHWNAWVRPKEIPVSKLYSPVALILFCLLPFQMAEAQVRCETMFTTVQAKPYVPGKSLVLQTFEREFDALAEFFVTNKNLSDADMTKTMMKADVRKSLFKIQALTRMLEGQNPKFFAQQRLEFKGLEDATGKLDLAASLRKMATSLEEPALIEYFGKREVQAQTEFVASMKKSGFWQAPEPRRQL